MSDDSLARPLPRLIVLSDAARVHPAGADTWLGELLPQLLLASKPGSVAVQLRHKDAPACQRLQWGRVLRAMTRQYGHWLVVNERLDLVRLLDADGVHLPDAGVSVADARVIAGPKAWIFRAWHGEDLRGAFGSGTVEHLPDAWVLSPVVEARKGRSPLGTSGLREICARQGSRPIYALGGITDASAAGCLEAGAAGVAVIGAAGQLPRALRLIDALGIARA